MKIPKKLKIGGFTWNVKLESSTTSEQGLFGATHFPSQTIYIQPDITPQKQEHTLIHEVLHAIFWQNGLPRIMADDKQEEMIINSVSFGIHAFLKDNGLLK